jgi:thiamine-phosphate pyrophosphorylase
VKPLAECRLYTFIDTGCPGSRSAAEAARQLCDGGSDLIQLRAKDAPKDQVLRLAEEIQPILRAANVGFVINDHWDIACKIGADLCHLGQEDFFDTGLTHAAQLTVPNGLSNKPQLGLSTHAPEQAMRAIAAEPAYIAIGPVFATPTKPGRPGVTLDYVRWAAANIKIPWFAIGGINLTNIDEVLAAGATRICTVRAILDAADISATCRQFKNILYR